jgi:hypothetical protein
MTVAIASVLGATSVFTSLLGVALARAASVGGAS